MLGLVYLHSIIYVTHMFILVGGRHLKDTFAEREVFQDFLAIFALWELWLPFVPLHGDVDIGRGGVETNTLVRGLDHELKRANSTKISDLSLKRSKCLFSWQMYLNINLQHTTECKTNSFQTIFILDWLTDWLIDCHKWYSVKALLYKSSDTIQR